MKENELMLKVVSGDGEQGLISFGAILDRQYLTGPITKGRLEDLQLWSALKALAVNGGALHPLASQSGDDPPDRLLSHNGRTWGIELTELTIEDVRGDLARVRMFGRQFQQRLKDNSRFAHLRGRVVMLTKRPEQQLPRDVRQLVSELETALADDKGCFDGSANSASEAKGWYGTHGPFIVLVNKSGEDNGVQVNAVTHSEIMRGDALRALGRRVLEKDRPGNDLVIVTCGLPDKNGYVCPYDHAIYMALREVITEEGRLLSRTPTHIRGGLIHLWDTDMLISWSEEGEAVPWTGIGF